MIAEPKGRRTCCELNVNQMLDMLGEILDVAEADPAMHEFAVSVFASIEPVSRAES